MIKEGFVTRLPEQEEVGLETEGLTFRLIQENQECEGDYEELAITIRNNGGGDFYEFSSESWSINKPEDLVKLVAQINKMIEAFKTK